MKYFSCELHMSRIMLCQKNIFEFSHVPPPFKNIFFVVYLLLKASFFSKHFQGFFCTCNVLLSRVKLFCNITRTYFQLINWKWWSILLQLSVLTCTAMVLTCTYFPGTLLYDNSGWSKSREPEFNGVDLLNVVFFVVSTLLTVASSLIQL